jgi:ribonuclease Z
MDTKLIFLGTASAVPEHNHENTNLALSNHSKVLLIDCSVNPIVRLEQAGLDLHQVSDLIVTHFHPDHVAGLPLLLMGSWLLGRQKPLNIYGLAHTLDRIKDMMDGYEWHTWPNLFPVDFHELPTEEMHPAIIDTEWTIHSSPVQHLIPTIGLRIELKPSGKTLAYSCDTSPCSEVARLAQNAYVLIHEATGEYPGHSSALQAGQVAQKANAEKLFLIHYSKRNGDPNKLIAEAQTSFDGPVVLADDLMTIDPFTA